ncbi:hypothetical protein BKA56DRAFT_108283 [Ilyonectria sp. MPI-CAGE-AT-0026]|nr:hypothetical protein BKA56DRAFT_108283 [Ilyonectria sp. MPI-CAGE-AT-0026]
MPSSRIFAWLDTIPHNCESRPVPATHDPSLSRKRRRLYPPTPEHSATKRLNDAMSAHAGSPDKRPNDETHKPSRSSKRLRESSRSFPPSQSQCYTSTRSGQASTLRDLAALERDQEGLKLCELSTFHPQPPSLEVLLEQIEAFSYAERILPASVRDRIERLDGAEYWDMKWATQGPRSFQHYSTEREALGCTPSPDYVHKLVSEAAECSANCHPEANWNMEVHSRILDIAFDTTDDQARLVKCMGSPTASIIQEYHRSVSRTKKVDFCIYLEPSVDNSYPEAEDDIDRLSMTLRGEVINHTDFYPLRNRPIAMSIETTNPDESWEKAMLQFGVWESARWAFLRYLFDKYEDQVAQDEAAQGHQGYTPAPPPSLSRLPEFLPGIIVQGHDWNLVITTQQGERTILWQRILMGTTMNPKGVYQIVCCLQLLRQWTQDTFWPWLKEVIRQSSKSCPG